MIHHRLWAGKNIHYALSRLRMGLYLRFLRSLRSRLFHESSFADGVSAAALRATTQVFSRGDANQGHPIFFLAQGS